VVAMPRPIHEYGPPISAKRLPARAAVLGHYDASNLVRSNSHASYESGHDEEPATEARRA
jgi:hypothetical protein